MDIVVSLLAIAIVRYAIWILNWRDTLAGMAWPRFKRHVSANDVANIRYRSLYKQSLDAEVAESEFVAGLTTEESAVRLHMLEQVDDGLMAVDDLLHDQVVKDRAALYLMSKDQLTVIANNHIEWAKLRDDIDATLEMHMAMRQRLAQPQVASLLSQ